MNYTPSKAVLETLAPEKATFGTHHGRGRFTCAADARLVGRLEWWNRPHEKGERRDKEGVKEWEALIFQHGNGIMVAVVWLERFKSGAVSATHHIPENFEKWFKANHAPELWEQAEALIKTESPMLDDAPSSQTFDAAEILQPT